MMGLNKHTKFLPHPLANGEAWDDCTPRLLHPMWRLAWSVNATAWLDDVCERVRRNPHSCSALTCDGLESVSVVQLHEVVQTVWTSMKKGYLKANGCQDDAADKASDSRQYQRKMAVRTCCYADAVHS